MEVDRPGPGEELNLGASPAPPRQAATVIVLQGGAQTLEVLLVQRNPQQRFMGGAWVFPGGAVDADDGDGTLAHRLAGVREVEEEAGVRLPGPEALLPFSRWITPAQVKIRFDTHFFLARVPAGAEPVVDGSECVGWGWWTPRAALDAYAAGDLLLVFPTIKTLEALRGFESADALLAWAEGRQVVPIEPRVVVEGEVARVVLPGEPGYEP
jgi:8-oxo-dGTP pyrophosphatase MutT (NUDIX family)